MRHTRFLAVCLVLWQAPGAVHAQSRQELQLSADVRMLHEQVSRLQLAANQLGDRISALDKRLDAQETSAIKGFADQQLRLNGLTQTLAVIREKLDDNNTRAAQLTQELTAVIASIRIINDQLSTLTNLLQPAVNPINPDVPVAGPAPAATAGLPPSPSSLINQAMADYFSNRLDLAIEGFQEFVEKFPDAPDAAKAQFHIGQSYYDQKKYKEAVAAYAKVISNYKNSDQAAEAYFMQGVCYVDLGQTANARAAFQATTKLFPGSTQAMRADQRLKALGPQ